MHPKNPSIAEVRALVREEGSSLLDGVSDAQIDTAIRRDINRPAATIGLLAGSAIGIVELEVLIDKLRQAVSDGSVLDSEPATDEEMRAFRRVKHPPPPENQALAYAKAVAGEQVFLGRRLYTLATDIVLEAGGDTNAADRALAVGNALFSVAAFFTAIARKVIDAMPPDEWAVLREARLRSWMYPVEQIAAQQPAA
jgi:hypothetical protein